jgi:hypothetical protein
MSKKFCIKNISVFFLTALCSTIQQIGICQGTFRNLDFESANVPVVPSGQLGADVSMSDALPYWAGFYGQTEITTALHNRITLGGVEIVIFGPQSPPYDILQGNYSVLIAGTRGAPPGSGTSAAIAQVGQVPLNAKSLLFLASPGSVFDITFSGQELPISDLLYTGTDFVLLGADISRFAGLTGELRFSALPDRGGYLDNITFSTIAVPEPSIFALFGICAVATCLWRRR